MGNIPVLGYCEKSAHKESGSLVLVTLRAEDRIGSLCCLQQPAAVSRHLMAAIAVVMGSKEWESLAFHKC